MLFELSPIQGKPMFFEMIFLVIVLSISDPSNQISHLGGADLGMGYADPN